MSDKNATYYRSSCAGCWTDAAGVQSDDITRRLGSQSWCEAHTDESTRAVSSVIKAALRDADIVARIDPRQEIARVGRKDV